MSIFGNLPPQPVLLQFGQFKVYWYGLLIVTAALISYQMLRRLAKNNTKITDSHLSNLFFYLIIFGVIGARVFHVLFYNVGYFINNPWEIFKIWHGGLAIFGSVFSGLAVIYFYTKKFRLNFLTYANLLAVVMPLGQAIGRWGNYFNQELFGRPCQGWFCLPIEFSNRPELFRDFNYFEPAFLYEFVLLFCLFALLLRLYQRGRGQSHYLIFIYLFGYSAIRFTTEFIRIDTNASTGGLKIVQWFCLAVAAISIGCIIKIYRKNPAS